MVDIPPEYILLPAFILDLSVGDPRWLFHPVRWMGNAIDRFEPIFRERLSSPFVAGVLFALTLIAGTWLATYLLVASVGMIHPAAQFAVEAILLFFCISARSLGTEAMTVGRYLETGDINSARSHVGMIVGRDVKNLTERGIARAAVETVAENLVDGCMAPLFFAAIGGVPMAMAYKMVNTLDSMVGYKNETYRYFGRAAARIDDVANWIPARLSVPFIALSAKIMTGRGGAAFSTAINEGSNHSSPNAGFPEAAFAGTLGICLGGPNVYHGKLVEKPYIGTGLGETRPGHIRRGCDLMLLTATLWVCFLSVIRFVVGWLA